jgi:sporulation protein YlmC with PRC-barrel domain
MLFSQILRHQVVSTGTQDIVGYVDGLLVDPSTGKVAALRIGQGLHGDTVLWDDIEGFSPYAVAVGSAGAARPAEGRAAELLASDHQIMGKRLVTEAGEQIGRVTDVEFDLTTGSVTRLLTTDGPIRADYLPAAGAYAAVNRRA